MKSDIISNIVILICLVMIVVFGIRQLDRLPQIHYEVINAWNTWKLDTITNTYYNEEGIYTLEGLTKSGEPIKVYITHRTK